MIDHGHTFGRRIRAARKRECLTQRQLAEAIGIDYTYLSKLENDQPGQSPAELTVRRIAQVLKEDPDELLSLAGKVPVDDLRQRAGRDVTFARFLRTLPGLSDQQVTTILREIDKDASKPK